MTSEANRIYRVAFGLCVRSLRRRVGIAQEALALASEIDRGYMGALERGQHSPSLDMLFRMLPPLKVTFVEFATEYEKCLRRARREQKKNGQSDLE
jgi:transcriptional regulator with XRE-family HTH domain